MQRKTKRIIGAFVVIAAIAAGGAAFTASNTVPNTVAGYGTSKPGPMPRSSEILSVRVLPQQ